MVILKLDKGFIEKLIKDSVLISEKSLNLTGEELTYELKDKELVVQFHKDEKTIEITDINGTFGLWFKLKEDKVKKLKEITGSVTQSGRVSAF